MRAALWFAATVLLSACVTEPLHEEQPDPACRDARSPEFVVCQFYGRYLTLQPEGLPGEIALDVLSPFITPELESLLYATFDARERYVADYPERPVPLAEGALFMRNFVPARQFTVLRRVPIDRDRVGVEVGMRGDSSQWRELVVLRLTREGFLVDDIHFGGAGADEGTLRRRLP
ncbi:hypothetical protein K8B33_12935 [Alcanivorax sp. JB21]|uniref:hypothetical protein n=1 Tax=Alcanivorax limicola TaxID=2874102 RepID=UPI001CBB2C55|nr:hypothetical protein [Alcanivorax limicola]MBZ2190006.1 hypothetical protein [Alcanivorax limicola]